MINKDVLAFRYRLNLYLAIALIIVSSIYLLFYNLFSAKKANSAERVNSVVSNKILNPAILPTSKQVFPQNISGSLAKDVSVFGDISIYLGENRVLQLKQYDLIQILERHHVLYFDINKSKDKNHLFPEDMDIAGVIDAIKYIVKNSRPELLRNWLKGQNMNKPPYRGNLKGEYKGIKYMMAFEDGYIKLFYPLTEKTKQNMKNKRLEKKL